MNLQRFIIFLSAAFFILYGLAFSIMPAAMAVWVTGTEPTGASALVDFRATYGGMTLAVGLIIFYLYSLSQIRASLMMVLIVLIGMAFTRAVGLIAEGSGNTLMVIYLILELFGGALAFYAMQRGDA